MMGPRTIASCVLVLLMAVVVVAEQSSPQYLRESRPVEELAAAIAAASAEEKEQQQRNLGHNHHDMSMSMHMNRRVMELQAMMALQEDVEEFGRSMEGNEADVEDDATIMEDEDVLQRVPQRLSRLRRMS